MDGGCLYHRARVGVRESFMDLWGDVMEERVSKLETDMHVIDKRISIVETELQHGSTIFQKIEATVDSMAERLSSHMDREEGRTRTRHNWEKGILITIVLGLAGYIWKTHIPGM